MVAASIDFRDTFAPIVSSATSRVVLSIVITNHWPIR